MVMRDDEALRGVAAHHRSSLSITTQRIGVIVHDMAVTTSSEAAGRHLAAKAVAFSAVEVQGPRHLPRAGRASSIVVATQRTSSLVMSHAATRRGATSRRSCLAGCQGVRMA